MNIPIELNIQEPTSQELESIFNWYSKNLTDPTELSNTLVNYFQVTKGITYEVPQKILSRINKEFIYSCHLLSNNTYLPFNNLQWFLGKVEGVEELLKGALEDTRKKPKDIKGSIHKTSQDVFFGIEDITEEWAINNFQGDPKFAGIIRNLKGIHANILKNFIHQKIQEYNEVLVDQELREAYSHISTPNLKKLVRTYERLYETCENIINHSKSTRKPRTRKVKPVKAKFCPNHPELPIQGILPEVIVGSRRAIVFDVKYRKLGCYYSDTGMTIKGTTIYNFDSTRSFQKILRKPDKILTGIHQSGIVEFNKEFLKIKTVSQKLTGRLNENTLILYAGD